MHSAAWLRVAITTGLIAALLLSWRLWTGPRFYPLTPVLPFLRAVPPLLEMLLYLALIILATFIGLAVFIGGVPDPAKLISLLAAVALVLAVFDQSRWQPWFYQYVFMLLALRSGLNTCRLIIIFTYFWSGVQKLPANFADDVFAWLAEPVTRFFPAAAHPLVHAFGVTVPFIEIAMAIGLMFKKTRRAAVILAIGMHVFILIAIGPFGHDSNNVVWPWNLVMVACVLLLFWRTGAGFRDLVWVKHSVVHKLVLVLFGIAPVLSFFNMWDSYLSAALYAPNKHKGDLFFTDAVFEKLPEKVQDLATDEGPNSNRIDISDWSFRELNVPPYPEIRIYKNVAKAVCAYASQPSDVRLVVNERAALIGGGRTISYDCRQLAAANFK